MLEMELVGDYYTGVIIDMFVSFCVIMQIS